MGIRVGSVTLPHVQTVDLVDGRRLVEHQLPGATGSIFQDLGRRAVRLSVRGVLLGERSLTQIQSLREMHARAEPQQFAADVAVGSELTAVVIEELDIQQVPGHRARFHFGLLLREWREPAPTPAAAVSRVDAALRDVGHARTNEGVTLAGALANPRALASLLTQHPEFLARVSVKDIKKSVLRSMGELNGDTVASLLAAVSKIDTQLLNQLIEELSEADSLGDLFAVLSDDGVKLLEVLSGVDLSAMPALVRAVVGGPEFLDQLAKVGSAAKSLWAEIEAYRPAAELSALHGGPS